MYVQFFWAQHLSIGSASILSMVNNLNCPNQCMYKKFGHAI